MSSWDDKEAVLYRNLYGVHKELLEKHWAFKQCVLDAMEEYLKLNKK